MAPAVALTCEGPTLTLDEQVNVPFRQAVQALADPFRTLPDVDRCATIEVLGTRPGVVVHVILADGRSTVRRVDAPEAMRSTLEALLTIPPAVMMEHKADKPTANIHHAAARAEHMPQVRRTVAASSKPHAMHSIHAEIGLEASFHVSAAPVFLGYGLAARAVLRVDDWVFQVPARWDIDDRYVSGVPPSGFDMQSFLLGATAGRQFSTKYAVVDVTVGPHVVFENQEAYGPGEEGIGGAFGDVSVASWLRIAWPRTASWRGSAALCFEMYPRRVGRVVYADQGLPPLPAWGLTVSFGMAYEAL